MNLHESKANCNLCIEKHGVSGDEIDQAHEAVKGRMIAMNRSQFIGELMNCTNDTLRCPPKAHFHCPRCTGPLSNGMKASGKACLCIWCFYRIGGG